MVEKTRHLYPNIAEIFKNYFCSLATSVPCERVFSKAGLLLTKRRNRLKGNKAKMVMFLNHNQIKSPCINTPKGSIEYEEEDEEKLQNIISNITKNYDCEKTNI